MPNANQNPGIDPKYLSIPIIAVVQGSFYAANWLILANFDPNFVIPEISVKQVRKHLACMLGGFGQAFLDCLSSTDLLRLCPF